MANVKSTNVPRRAGRPLKGDAKRVRMSFTLPPRIVGWLRELAEDRQQTMSEVLETELSSAKPVGTHSSVLPIPYSKRELERFCRKNRIKSIAVFGSALRDDFGPESDLDLLVSFLQGSTPGLFDLMSMQEELKRIFGGRNIDLRTTEDLSPYFKADVLAEARPLYG